MLINVMKMWQIEHSHQEECVEDYIVNVHHKPLTSIIIFIVASRVVMVWV